MNRDVRSIECETGEKLFRRTVLLIALFAVPVSMVLWPTVLNNNDLWFHMRTGQWILDHMAFPHTDPFSLIGEGKSWAAYSWLFEIAVYGFYRAFNLVGVVIFDLILSLAITWSLYRLLSRLQPSFPKSVVLTAVGSLSLAPLFSPRPWLFTILFFIIELDILLRVRTSGEQRRLLILPPLFCLWANLHIQFLYGLFLLAVFAMEPNIWQKISWMKPHLKSPTVSARHWVTVLVFCVLATLVNPYHFGLYGVLLDYATQSGHLKYIREFHSLPFRDWHSFLILFISLGGAFALGRARPIKALSLILLISGAFISFRSIRDCWFVVIVSLTIISRSVDQDGSLYKIAISRKIFIAASVVLVLLGIGWSRNVSNRGIEASISKDFPVEATRVIAERKYPGPLYNYYDWGSYLIWKLPDLPVYIDGRTHLYGDARIAQSFSTWNGSKNWNSDPGLRSSRLVVGPSDKALTSLLRCDSDFELAYEDSLATVFVRRAQRSLSK